MLDSFGFELILSCLHISVKKNNRTPPEVPKLQLCKHTGEQSGPLLSWAECAHSTCQSFQPQRVPSQAYQHVPQASSYLHMHKHVVSGNKQQSLI